MYGPSIRSGHLQKRLYTRHASCMVSIGVDENNGESGILSTIAGAQGI